MNESFLLDKNYLEKFEYCQSFHKEPVGITNLDSPKNTETILIKQNNFIITLLISLHKKIDNLEKTIGKTKIPESSLNIENDLKFITWKLGNLNLSKTGKETITRKLPREFNFPRWV